MIYLDSTASQSLRKLKKVLLYCSYACLVIGAIAVIAAISDDDPPFLGLFLFVSGIYGLIGNILLKGFISITEASECIRADFEEKCFEKNK